MADYIDRSAIATEYVKLRRKSGYDDGARIDGKIVAQLIERAIDNLPAADVAPIVHGEWIEQPDATHFCSECGKDALWEQYDNYCFREKLSDICPNCGAKMEVWR